MAPVPARVQTERPSFAKVAAAGLKTSSAQQNSSQSQQSLEHGITSSPRDMVSHVFPTNQSQPLAMSPDQKEDVAIASSNSKELESTELSGPAVHVHTADSLAPRGSPSVISEGMLAAATADEIGTQVSSSIDFAKPASLDGKSVASGTTFTLDEKESLRPDDSASVMARDDEEVFTHQGAGLPEARTGSDDERQAFSDQLREISDMDVSRQVTHPHNFAHNAEMVQGVLYVPPQGPGVGNMPGSLRVVSDVIEDAPPDPKLLEALDSPKDRIMVLKLEQDIVDFVKDPKESSLKLPQTNAFYRMLAHKLADYYMLGHVVDESTMAVRIFKTPACRIPPPLTGIATPSTAASTPPPIGPQMKILRRGVDNSGPTIANGSSFTSKTTSENGESGNEDERKSRLLQSREEREARYEAARRRIMGSEVPSASQEEPQDKDNSRSSSVAGRKGMRKKQRSDSDDDFEARSAYSAYYPTAMAQNGSASGAYALPGGPAPSTQMSPASYTTQGPSASYQQYTGQLNQMWPNSTYHNQTPTQSWAQPQQPAYDLGRDFQRTMSLQSRGAPLQNPGAQQTYSTPYNQQMAGSQHGWPQQSPYMATSPIQPAVAYSQSYPNQPAQAQNAFQDTQPYAYGQLPSQAFPGRPPSKLEHPLPGSYKGKHFNPQSQSFIPGQTNGASPMQFQPAVPQMHPYSPGFSLPSPPHRQETTPLHNAAFTTPQSLGPTPTMPARASGPPMTHPLPQPVFPRQPSPNVPLPAKPVATPPRPSDKNTGGPAIVQSSLTSNSLGQSSSIAKWAAPASLPAKPPPPNESFDPAKFATQAQRQTIQSGPSTRSTLGGLPTFGSMPPVAGGLGVNGQSRRT